MKKIINPGKVKVWDNETANVFISIEFDKDNLSISGVVGPMRNGDCRGSCGQIQDELKEISPGEDWTKEMIDKLYGIWEKYHLNDMQAACSHQRALGWGELVGKKINLYHWTLDMETIRKQDAIKKNVLDKAKTGRVAALPLTEARLLSLEYAVTTSEPEAPAPEYQPRKQIYPGDRGHIEEKMLGWLRPEEHPDGILCRPCPECGYKYGTKWLRMEVPDDVVEWLFNLPETKITPAWV